MGLCRPQILLGLWRIGIGDFFLDKAEKFLIKIRSRNYKRKLLKEKKAIYSKLLNYPGTIEECLNLKNEINFLEKELK